MRNIKHNICHGKLSAIARAFYLNINIERFAIVTIRYRQHYAGGVVQTPVAAIFSRGGWGLEGDRNIHLLTRSYSTGKRQADRSAHQVANIKYECVRRVPCA